MPSKTKKVTKTTRSHRKRVDQHPQHFLKVYWPYIPIVAVAVFGMFFGGMTPRRVQNGQPATLAYATEMGSAALLSATNTQRINNGLSGLTLNSALNASAQAKAQDMVAKDYWSHNTPSGQEPWVFFDAAGYNYQKAGENLAYGFSSSDATVVGWMNSPSHRANILDASYTEVGFGFANSPNFVGTGPETIVVAHYAKPVNAVAAPAPVAPAASQPKSTSQPKSLPAKTEAASEEVATAPVEEAAPTEEAKPTPVPADRFNQPITSDTPVPDDKPSTNITRVQGLTGGNAPWSAFAVSGIALTIVLLWIVKHAVIVKRYFWVGEHFAAHHPVFDLAVISVAAIAVYLSQSSGVVL